MTDDEKIRFTDFLSAAKRTLTGEQTAEEQAREKKRTASTAAKMECYRQFIRPVTDALCALPEKNGKKFSCTVRCDDNSHAHVLRIRILYYTPNVARPEFSSLTKKLNIAMYDGTEGISFAVLSYDNSARFGDSTVIPVKSAAEISAALGKWVAQAAPERLSELEKALGNEEPRKIKAFKPLQLQNPKK